MFWMKKSKEVEVKEREIYIPSPNLDMKLLTISVNKMFNKDYYCICDIDTIQDTFRLCITRDDLYKRLRILHCMDYEAMDKETYEFCVEWTKELIRTSFVKEKANHKVPVFSPSDFTW